MTIKDILAKVRKGEALTDEEKAALEAFDPDKVADSKAAAARKEAEKQRDALKAQLAELEGKLEEAGNAGKSEVEQLKGQVAKMAKAVEDSKALVAKAEGEKRALVRSTKLDRIMGNLKIVEGVDQSLPRLALERVLADLKDEDLDVETAVNPLVEAFKAKNKAILLDQSGGGAGTPPKDGTRGVPGSKPLDQMTAAERAAQLKQQGIV